MATISTGNLTIGQVDLYYTASSAHSSLIATDNTVSSGYGGAFRTAGRNLGNIVTAEVAPDVTYVDHFVADKGRMKKDKIAANITSIAIPFTFDEINAANIEKYFLASDLGSNRYAVMEAPLKVGCAQLYFDTDVGTDITYIIPKCTIRPDGNMGINADDWWSGPMVLEILYYNTGQWATKPYGVVQASNI